MDREILFRGKRADNGEWIYGNLFIPDNPDKPVEILIGTNSVRISYEVIPETVGQYTGLLDKNGTKIFEGDIILWRFTPCVVKWDSDNACYSLYQNGITKVSGFNADTMKLLEVIGTIYDGDVIYD